jgi:uncharacterized protein YrrD
MKGNIMLSKVKTLKGYRLDALDELDGKIGKVKEFYFDDRFWTIRYLVAETGTWLASRKVLISPYALVAIFNEEKTIDVALTKKRIEDSPSLDTDKPVSRQFEDSFYGYYDIPVYWAGPHRWGYCPDIERDRGQWKVFTSAQKSWDPHLRSTHAVSGYYIHATDGEIGHVEDFIIDDETWEIRYLIVNTSNWWAGKKVLVSPQWIDRVSWDDKTVFINLSHEAIKQSPEYTDESLLTRDYEIGLHGHYNRKGYWVDELVNS